MNTGSVLASLADIWRGLWHYAQGRRGRLAGALLLLAGAEALRLPLPWMAGRAIDELQSRQVAGMATALQWLALSMAGVAAAWCLHASGRILERHVALHARCRLSLDLTERVLRQPLSWHRREHPLTTSQRAQQGATALTEFAENQYVYLQGALQMVGPLAALALISPRAAAVAAVGLALLATCSLGFDRVLLALAERRNDAERRLGTTWGELLVRVPTLLALRLQSGALRLVQRRVDALLRPLGRLVLFNELKWGAVDIFGHLLWCTVVVVHVAGASAAGAIALGSVFMVYEYARRAETAIATLAADFSMLSGQLAGWRALRPLLSATEAQSARHAPCPAWSRLELGGASVQPDPSAPPVLQGVTLVLERGRRYAVLGESGAGKSTLLLLLAGLEPPSSGTLALDGRPVEAATLRAEATLVDGAALPFEGSVRENVAPGGDIDDTALTALLANVDLLELVRSRPGDYDSPVSEGLARWSQGEVQRLALARGLHAAAGASLLLLDEPTSHLPPAAAAATMRRLLALHSGACVVAAVHDRSLVRHFDACIHVSLQGVRLESLPAVDSEGAETTTPAGAPLSS